MLQNDNAYVKGKLGANKFRTGVSTTKTANKGADAKQLFEDAQAE